MELIQYFEKCKYCKREILVMVALFGVSHNAGIFVVCKECLRKKGMDNKFKTQSPELTKEIEEWLKEE